MLSVFFCLLLMRFKDFISKWYSSLDRHQFDWTVKWVWLKIVLVALWVHLYRSIIVVTIIPRPNLVECNENIHYPPLAKMIFPACANTYHYTKTFSILILSAYKLVVYEELRTIHIKYRHTRICTKVEARCCLLEVILIFTHHNAKLKLSHGDNTASRAIDEWLDITNSACRLIIPTRVYAAFNLIYVCADEWYGMYIRVKANIILYMVFMSAKVVKKILIRFSDRIKFGLK